MGHKFRYKFCGELYGLSGLVNRFSGNFQLHGLLWPKSSKSTMSSYTTLKVFRPILFRFELWDINVGTNFVETFISYSVI